MAEFCLFCIIVFLVVVFWEFFAAVGALLIAYVGCYLLVSEFKPEIDINYRMAAQDYVKTEDQIEYLVLWDTDNAEEKEKLIKHRADLIDQMRQFIIDKKIWKKYDKKDQENGIKLAMTNRINKEEKTIRERQKKESKR